MIYIRLFLAFLKIGAVSFGGGYGMISLIRETVLTNSWLTEKEFMAFVAVSESTPGPLAVNMATFVGSSQGGIFGAFLATLGVILPAFILILLLVACLKNLLKYRGVEAFLRAVRPCVAALILATAVIMGLDVFCGIKHLEDAFAPHIGRIFVFLVLSVWGAFAKRAKQKAPSPVWMIVVSAGLGILYKCL